MLTNFGLFIDIWTQYNIKKKPIVVLIVIIVHGIKILKFGFYDFVG